MPKRGSRKPDNIPQTGRGKLHCHAPLANPPPLTFHGLNGRTNKQVLVRQLYQMFQKVEILKHSNYTKLPHFWADMIARQNEVFFMPQRMAPWPTEIFRERTRSAQDEKFSGN